MKESLRCPKCTGQKLWRIHPLETVYEYSPGTLPLHLNYKQETGNEGMFAEKEERVGTLTAYICAACGYSELWADGLEELRVDAERGVELIDTTQDRGAYR